MNTPISKIRFAAGLQCHKLLWWTIHEPDAPELARGADAPFVLEEEGRVLAAARARFPGGVLIDLPREKVQERVEATRLALAQGVSTIFGATFSEDGMVVTVDILTREDQTRTLIKVLPSISISDPDLWDAGAQSFVLRRGGVDVDAVEIMHLNPACRAPELEDLFITEAVSGRVRGLFPQITKALASQSEMLDGPIPDTPVGRHCDQPQPCPFKSRCWPALPEHSVETFHGLRREKSAQLSAQGLTTVAEVPDSFPLTIIQQRQRKSVTEGELQVEGNLTKALSSFRGRVGYMAFQTVSPAIPAWDGFGPWSPHPVQFSCHITSPKGKVDHVEWLAEGADDARSELAQLLVDSLGDVDVLLAYDAGFEKKCLDALASAAPEYAAELKVIASKLNDLLPVVKNHVYHADFLGSFDLHPVLSALAPEGVDEGLDPEKGPTQESRLHGLLFQEQTMTSAEKKALRKELLEQGAMASMALLRLKERLDEVAAG